MSHRKLFTLVFARRDSQILLGLKKRGFGYGKWNGFGGKIEPGETLHQAAVREVEEECGLKVKEQNLHHVGHLEFYFPGDPVIMVVKVFTTFKFEGDLVESDEMKPKWFNLAAVPYKDMWPDDKYWFPNMLKSSYFAGSFWYQDQETILRQDLRTISEDDLLNMSDSCN